MAIDFSPPPYHTKEFEIKWKRWITNYVDTRTANTEIVFLSPSSPYSNVSSGTEVSGNYWVIWEIPYADFGAENSWIPVSCQIILDPLWDDYPTPRVVWKTNDSPPKVAIHVHNLGFSPTDSDPFEFIVTFLKPQSIVEVV